MKIIFLNAWEGKLREEIFDFIREHSSDTDIFCFQESQGEMERICAEILSDYNRFFQHKQINAIHYYDQAIYVKRGVEIISSGSLLETGIDTGLGLYVEVKTDSGNMFICNMHGISQPGEKLDNEGRLEQSRVPIDFFKNKEGLKIIGGDFNLMPETESIQMFVKNGYRDLIKDYAIRTTRNHYAWDMYPGNPMYYSDYVFTSKEVKVRNFKVIENEVSDHLPLILEIDL